MSLVIRSYQDRDLGDLLSVWEKASAMAHSFLTQEFLEMERDRVAHVYTPRADTWVAESDGEVIGFIALVGKEVGALFVQPSHHSRGIGRALLDKAREIHGDLEVEVFEANVRARRFYRDYGFVPLRTQTDDETGHRLWRLGLSLEVTPDTPTGPSE